MQIVASPFYCEACDVQLNWYLLPEHPLDGLSRPPSKTEPMMQTAAPRQDTAQGQGQTPEDWGLRLHTCWMCSSGPVIILIPQDLFFKSREIHVVKNQVCNSGGWGGHQKRRGTSSKITCMRVVETKQVIFWSTLFLLFLTEMLQC